MTQAQIHISSMVVHTHPLGMQSVKQQIEGMSGAEVRAESPAGKLVVVLESDDQRQITSMLETIHQFDQVLGAALVYHQIETLETDGMTPS